MVLLGLEFMVKNYITLAFILMFNLGILQLNSAIQVISISLITIIVQGPLFKFFNKHIPFLIGKPVGL
jgi:hypothetical protein